MGSPRGQGAREKEKIIGSRIQYFARGKAQRGTDCCKESKFCTRIPPHKHNESDFKSDIFVFRNKKSNITWP